MPVGLSRYRKNSRKSATSTQIVGRSDCALPKEPCITAVARSGCPAWLPPDLARAPRPPPTSGWTSRRYSQGLRRDGVIASTEKRCRAAAPAYDCALALLRRPPPPSRIRHSGGTGTENENWRRSLGPLRAWPVPYRRLHKCDRQTPPDRAGHAA